MDLQTINEQLETIVKTKQEWTKIPTFYWAEYDIESMSEGHVINALAKVRQTDKVREDLQAKGCEVDSKYDGRSYDEWLSVFTAELKQRVLRNQLNDRYSKLCELKRLATKEEQRTLLIAELEEGLKG